LTRDLKALINNNLDICSIFEFCHYIDAGGNIK
jgi:hypothetical protein